MSPATDILTHSGSLIPSRTVARRKPLSYPKKGYAQNVPPFKPKRPKPPTPPGVYVQFVGDKIKYRPSFTINGKLVSLGNFATPERANLARKLYSLWQRRGFEDIPHKPTTRVYGNR